MDQQIAYHHVRLIASEPWLPLESSGWPSGLLSDRLNGVFDNNAELDKARKVEGMLGSGGNALCDLCFYLRSPMQLQPSKLGGAQNRG